MTGRPWNLTIQQAGQGNTSLQRVHFCGGGGRSAWVRVSKTEKVSKEDQVEVKCDETKVFLLGK